MRCPWAFERPGRGAPAPRTNRTCAQDEPRVGPAPCAQDEPRVGPAPVPEPRVGPAAAPRLPLKHGSFVGPFRRLDWRRPDSLKARHIPHVGRFRGRPRRRAPGCAWRSVRAMVRRQWARTAPKGANMKLWAVGREWETQELVAVRLRATEVDAAMKEAADLDPADVGQIVDIACDRGGRHLVAEGVDVGHGVDE